MKPSARPKKRRRLDEKEDRDENAEREEHDESNRHRLRPRRGASVRVTTVEDDKHAATRTPRPAASEPSYIPTPSSKKEETTRPAPDIAPPNPVTENENEADARPGGYIDEEPLPAPSRSVSRPSPPLFGHDLDRLNYHFGLRDLGTSLQRAANAVFGGDRRSRYTRVSALLLSWEDEDPRLPVSVEIGELRGVFVDVYGFEVREWRIPDVDSHAECNMDVLGFLKEGGAGGLRIVYYAGQ